MKAKLSDIAGIINKIAPPTFAEEWDNCGLQLGDPASVISRVMVALDPLPEVIDAAIAESCQLLITHHPLIFKALKRISTGDTAGRCILRAAAKGLAVVSLHTNYDIATGGVNDLLAGAIGLKDALPLKVTSSEELCKLVIFVPESHHAGFMEAMLPHAAQLGNYSECSFSTSGNGTFKPLESSAPFIGTVGNRETVAELRVEILVQKSGLSAALKALTKAHPYEEPAFDIVLLHNRGATFGIGRIGEIESPASLLEYMAHLKKSLGVQALRFVGDRNKKVTRVALCGGSGAFLIGDAARQGADLFITGDLKYHEAHEARELGIAVVDAGHFGTEQVMVEGLSLQLEKVFAKRKYEVEVVRCSIEKDPLEFI